MMTRVRASGTVLGAALGAAVLGGAAEAIECLTGLTILCPIPQHLRAGTWLGGAAAGAVLGFFYGCVAEQLLIPGPPRSRFGTWGLLLGVIGGLGWPGSLAVSIGALFMDAHSVPSRGFARIAAGWAVASAVLLIAFLIGGAMLADETERDR